MIGSLADLHFSLPGPRLLQPPPYFLTQGTSPDRILASLIPSWFCLPELLAYLAHGELGPPVPSLFLLFSFVCFYLFFLARPEAYGSF